MVTSTTILKEKNNSQTLTAKCPDFRYKIFAVLSN
jgi:hypothetical protein